MDFDRGPILDKEIEISFGIDGCQFYQGYRNEFDAGGVPVEIFLALIKVKGEEKSICSSMEGCVHLQNTDQVLEFVRLFSHPKTWFLFPSPGIEVSHFIKEERVLEDYEWEEEHKRTIREYVNAGFTEDEALNDCLDLISRSKFEELKALGLFEVRVNVLEDNLDAFSVERCVCTHDNKIQKIHEIVRSDGHYRYETLNEMEPEGYKINFPRYE